MKITYAFLLCLALSFSACEENKTMEDAKALEGKLQTTLIDNPRSLQDSSNAKLNTLGRLQFVDTLHNFGIMQEGEIIEYEFIFNNAGGKDILINEAKASCGCTVPNYPVRPIKPGEQEKIKVTFNSEGKTGMNDKKIVVITNGNPSVYNLYIQAQVNKK